MNEESKEKLKLLQVVMSLRCKLIIQGLIQPLKTSESRP